MCNNKILFIQNNLRKSTNLDVSFKFIKNNLTNKGYNLYFKNKLLKTKNTDLTIHVNILLKNVN